MRLGYALTTLPCLGIAALVYGPAADRGRVTKREYHGRNRGTCADRSTARLRATRLSDYPVASWLRV